MRVGDTSAAIAASGVGLAIESTEQPGYTSTTTANVNSVSHGPNAQADGKQAVSLGYSAHGHHDGAIVSGWGAEGYGELIVLLGASGKIGTVTTSAGDGGGVAIGFTVELYGVNCLALGMGAKVGTSSTPLVSSAAIGTGASVTRDHEIVVGTASEVVVTPGGLALRDTSGQLWKLLVSTGGVLSTVAYP